VVRRARLSLLIDSATISKRWKDTTSRRVDPGDEPETVTTSGRRSSDLLTALVYWRGSPSSTYVNDRKHMRTTRIVVIPGRPHPLLSIRAKHQTTAIARLYRQLTQRLRNTSQEQDRAIRYGCKGIMRDRDIVV